MPRSQSRKPGQSFSAPEPPLRGQFADPFCDRAYKRLYQYLLAVNDWHGYIKFLGLPALRDTSRDVPLRNLFVEPRLGPGYLSPEAFDGENPPNTVRLGEAFRAHPRLVILGDPGSGKSTLVNWLCDVFSHSAPHPLRDEFGPLIPLPLIVRELGIGADITWEKLLATFRKRPVAEALDDEMLAPLLENGQALLLLDGIDEIGSVEVREALREAVWDGMKKYPRCRWVMTSRVVGYDEVPFELRETEAPEHLAKDWTDLRKGLDSGELDEDDFKTVRSGIRQHRRDLLSKDLERLYVAPFDDSQMDQFVRLWWTQHESNPALVGERSREFLDALRAHRATLTLARIPNLLTLVALIYRVFAFLPDGRSILYAKIAEAYLETIDEFRKLERPVPFTRKQKEAWLARVGWEMQRQRAAVVESGAAENAPGEILVERDIVLGWLTDEMGRQIGPEAATAAPLFLDYVGKRSGLLLPRGEGRYAFLHLSFQEYFAALWLCELLADPDWWIAPGEAAIPAKELQRWAGQPHWREVFIFLVESLGDRSPKLPGRLMRLLAGMKPGGSDWPTLRAPFPWKKSTNLAVGTAQTIELLAALAVDPHVSLDDAARREWRRLCWDWEMRRQREAHKNKGARNPWDNPVARLLLAQKGKADELLQTLVEEVPTTRISKALRLNGCTGLSDLVPLAKLTALQVLNLNDCPSLSDLAPLAKLSALQELYIGSCTGLSDLAPLAKLSALQTLWLNGCTGLSDLAPLAKLSALQELFIDGCIGVRPESVKILQKALPKLEIIGA